MDSMNLPEATVNLFTQQCSFVNSFCTENSFKVLFLDTPGIKIVPWNCNPSSLCKGSNWNKNVYPQAEGWSYFVTMRWLIKKAQGGYGKKKKKKKKILAAEILFNCNRHVKRGWWNFRSSTTDIAGNDTHHFCLRACEGDSRSTWELMSNAAASSVINQDLIYGWEATKDYLK